MKKTLLIFCALIGLQMNAQNKIEATGNVGIGTTEPRSELDVNGHVVIDKASSNHTSLQIGHDTLDRIYADNSSDKYFGGGMFFRVKSDSTLNISSGYIDALMISDKGNIGIGTKNLNSKLNVIGQGFEFYSNTINNTFKFGRNINENISLYVNDNTGALDYNQDSDGDSAHVFYIRNLAKGTSDGNDIRIQTENATRIAVKANGYIGIGTEYPSTKFHVKTKSVGIKSKYADAIIEGRDAQLDLLSNSDGTWGSSINFIEAFDNTINTNVWSIARQTTGGVGDSSLKFNFGIKNQHDNSNKVSFFSNGNVGIGTTNAETEWKLGVKGKIRAEEIKVETGWSDFVFYEDYKLPTLEEVENHIQEKGHLQNIPSAKEVAKNGIYLGEMNSKLLQKIEELTLYTIAQQKQLEAQNLKIKNLEKENKVIQNLVAQLLKLQSKVDNLK